MKYFLNIVTFKKKLKKKTDKKEIKFLKLVQLFLFKFSVPITCKVLTHLSKEERIYLPKSLFQLYLNENQFVVLKLTRIT